MTLKTEVMAAQNLKKKRKANFSCNISQYCIFYCIFGQIIATFHKRLILENIKLSLQTLNSSVYIPAYSLPISRAIIHHWGWLSLLWVITHYLLKRSRSRSLHSELNFIFLVIIQWRLMYNWDFLIKVLRLFTVLYDCLLIA